MATALNVSSYGGQDRLGTLRRSLDIRDDNRDSYSKALAMDYQAGS